MPSTAVVILIATLARSTSVSANCSGGQCMETDETSLVQVQSIVKHRPNDIDKGTEIPDLTEAGAFSSNYNKARDAVENDAADAISFNDAVRTVRQSEAEEARDRVEAAYKALHDAQLNNQNELEGVKDTRRATIEDAVNKVKLAKTDYLAHSIKRAKVDNAARLGRQMGAIEGKTDARRAWEDYSAEVTKEDKEDAIKQTKQAKEQAIKDYRDTLNRQTERMNERDDAYADAVERRVDSAKALDKAKTAIAMESIEGAGGLKNLVDNVHADWLASHYARHSTENEQEIEDATNGVIDDTLRDAVDDGPQGPVNAVGYGGPLDGVSAYAGGTDLIGAGAGLGVAPVGAGLGVAPVGAGLGVAPVGADLGVAPLGAAAVGADYDPFADVPEPLGVLAGAA